MVGMTERDERGSYTAFGRQFLRWTGENQEWFATRFFADVDVAPAHCLPDAGAERLGHGFFAGKSRGQMASGKFHRHGILNFVFGENAMEKTFTEAVDRVLNPRAFHQIDADSEDAHVRAALGFSEVAIDLGKLDRFKRSSWYPFGIVIRGNLPWRRAFRARRFRGRQTWPAR
jgi:hypothetical protein